MTVHHNHFSKFFLEVSVFNFIFLVCVDRLSNKDLVSLSCLHICFPNAIYWRDHNFSQCMILIFVNDYVATVLWLCFFIPLLFYVCLYACFSQWPYCLYHYSQYHNLRSGIVIPSTLPFLYMLGLDIYNLFKNLVWVTELI